MSFYIILDTLEEIVSDEKLPQLRWEYEAQNDLLPLPFTGCPYVMLGKQEYYCHIKDKTSIKIKRKCTEKTYRHILK